MPNYRFKKLRKHQVGLQNKAKPKPNKIELKPRHIILKLLKTKDEEKILKVV